MNNSKKVIIFIAYHKKEKILKSNFIFPVQSGSSINSKIPNILHDCEGENISYKNTWYNELCVHYWIWKNYDLDNISYVGLMHYRRHFKFSHSNITYNQKYGWLNNSCLKYSFNFPYYGYKYENILKDIENYDAILLKPYNIKNAGKESILIDYLSLKDQKIQYIEAFKKSVKENFPELTNSLDYVLNSQTKILCNMFIMKKNLFMKYSYTLFIIMNNVEKYLVLQNIQYKNSRCCGFLAEIFMTTFFYHYRKNINIKYMEGLFFYKSKLPFYWKVCKYFLLKHINKKYKKNYLTNLKKIKKKYFIKVK